MKKTFLALAIFTSICLPATVSRAQVTGFGNPMAILGTSNSVVLATNVYPATIKQTHFELTGMTNTLGSATYNVLQTLDKTNFVVVGSFIYSGSNDLSTNMQSYLTNVPVYTYLQAQTGTNTVLVKATYGP
jgi:hypothetical protein